MFMQCCLVMALVLASGPKTISPLLDDVSKRAVNYFWEQSNPKTGLTKDRAANFKDKDEYVVASVAATGYALAAYSIGAHRGWLDRAKALDRSRMTLKFLEEKGLKKRGWFYHFIDWRDGSRMWNSEASSIDTGLLLAGALMAQTEFKDAAYDALLKKIMDGIDWQWMLTNDGAMPNSQTLCMGWHPEDGFIKARWDQQWEENFLFVMALGVDQNLSQSAWKIIKRDIITFHGLKLVLGGPIFMHEMSQGFLDFAGQRDCLGFDYWVEGRNACLANRQYCIDNPKNFKGYGPDVWGLNAGDAPSGYVGNGAPGFGSDDGTVSPTGAIASVMYIPDEAESAAKTLKAEFPKSYGRYGFSNGINPAQNWVGPDVIGIDLGMVMLAIENARDGLPHKLSMSNPVIKRGMKKAGFHKTDEGPLSSRPLVLDN